MKRDHATKLLASITDILEAELSASRAAIVAKKVLRAVKQSLVDAPAASSAKPQSDEASRTLEQIRALVAPGAKAPKGRRKTASKSSSRVAPKTPKVSGRSSVQASPAVSAPTPPKASRSRKSKKDSDAPAIPGRAKKTKSKLGMTDEGKSSMAASKRLYWAVWREVHGKDKQPGDAGVMRKAGKKKLAETKARVAAAAAKKSPRASSSAKAKVAPKAATDKPAPAVASVTPIAAAAKTARRSQAPKKKNGAAAGKLPWNDSQIDQLGI